MHFEWRSGRGLACVSFAGIIATAALAMASQDTRKASTMPIHYLEFVTREVDAVCAAQAATLGVTFGEPDAGLGNARTARLPGQGMIGVRGPLRPDESPTTRAYLLVDDIKAAVEQAVKAGGEVAHPPMELPGHGTFAIYILGGIEHGLWER